MKTITFLFVCFLFLIAGGCGKTDSANINTLTPIEQKTVEVKKKLNLTLKEVTWATGDFKFLFPCNLTKTPERRSTSDFEVSETQACSADDLKFSVTFKTSKKNLREEFDKIKKENQVEETSVDKIAVLDYKRQTKSEKTTQSANEPNKTEIKYELSRHRLHLVNNSWLIDFEIVCSSNKDKYCDELIVAQADENITGFINSLKVK